MKRRGRENTLFLRKKWPTETLHATGKVSAGLHGAIHGALSPVSVAPINESQKTGTWKPHKIKANSKAWV